MAERPRVVAFDVVETLVSLDPLRSRFVDVGLPGEQLEWWFDRLQREGMALTLAGDFAPFPEVASAALRAISRGSLDDAGIRHVLAGFDQLPAQPDAAPALRTLVDAGVSVVCLSNGTAEATNRFLERSGLTAQVDAVISVTEVQSWKPSPLVYRHALTRAGAAAEQAALVAVHAFDCHGAARVGLTTGWSSRLEGRYSELYQQPDVLGRDLVEVVTGLLELPRSGAV